MRPSRLKRARSKESGAGIQPPSSFRRGATLVEVLAALLVMAIGVVSVMTLFPIAVLRSIQAAQLTNATILKLKADAQVEMFNLVGDRFIPTPREGFETHAVIDPLGWQDYASQSLVGGVADFYGTTASAMPYMQQLNRQRSKPPQFINPGAPPPRVVRDALIIRRLGFAQTPVNPGAAIYPGFAAGAGFFPVPMPVGPANPTVAREAALRATSLQDDFTTLFTGFPVANSPGRVGVAFNASDTDLSHIEHWTGGPQLLVPGSRAILVDANGKRSQIRTVEQGLQIQQMGAQWIISWPQPLPGQFPPILTDTFDSISEVRIESPSLRYSWMLTVRKSGLSGGSRADVDCVVFFNRPSGDPEDELVHGTSPPTPASGKQVNLTFTPYPSDPGRKPPLKRGGYLLDADNLIWYRIRDVTKVSAGTTSAVIDLDRPAERPIGNVIVPQGVIHVFPLKSRIDQTHLTRARRF